jgi:hypothetical protein
LREPGAIHQVAGHKLSWVCTSSAMTSVQLPALWGAIVVKAILLASQRERTECECIYMYVQNIYTHSIPRFHSCAAAAQAIVVNAGTAI